MTVSSHAQAYTQGYNARIRDAHRAVCPYAKYTLEWRAWYGGFGQAVLHGKGRELGR